MRRVLSQPQANRQQRAHARNPSGVESVINYNCYDIILDPERLIEFITFLPDLEDGESYYVALMARAKWMEGEKNQNSHINLRRFTATKKTLFSKLMQLETPTNGSWMQEEVMVAEESLGVYITPNPRSHRRAQLVAIEELARAVRNDSKQCPHQLALTALHKSPSRKIFFDIDIDFPPGWQNIEGENIEGENMFEEVRAFINQTLIKPNTKLHQLGLPYHFVRTKNGCHCLVRV